MKSKDPRHGRPGQKTGPNGITDIDLKGLKPVGKPVHVDKVVILPLAYGVIRGIHIVIPECPLCGMAHYHGSGGPGHYKKGDITTRVPHCLNRFERRTYNNMAIEIIDDVGPNGKVPGKSRKKKPRTDLPMPPMIEFPLEGEGKQ